MIQRLILIMLLGGLALAQTEPPNSHCGTANKWCMIYGFQTAPAGTPASFGWNRLLFVPASGGGLFGYHYLHVVSNSDQTPWQFNVARYPYTPSPSTWGFILTDITTPACTGYNVTTAHCTRYKSPANFNPWQIVWDPGWGVNGASSPCDTTANCNPNIGQKVINSALLASATCTPASPCAVVVNNFSGGGVFGAPPNPPFANNAACHLAGAGTTVADAPVDPCYFVIDNDLFHYQSLDACVTGPPKTGNCVGSTAVTLQVDQRTSDRIAAYRALGYSAAADHASGAWLWQSGPRSQHNFTTNSLAYTTNSLNASMWEPRHTFHFFAYDSNRQQLFNAGGRQETYSYFDAWLIQLCGPGGPACSGGGGLPQDCTGSNGTWTDTTPACNSPLRFTSLPVVTDSAGNGPTPKDGEGAIEYDPNADVMAQWGGTDQGQGQNGDGIYPMQLWVLCRSVLNNSAGCHQAGSFQGDGTHAGTDPNPTGLNYWYHRPTTCQGADGNLNGASSDCVRTGGSAGCTPSVGLCSYSPYAAGGFHGYILTYDPDIKQMIMFGGLLNGGASPYCTFPNNSACRNAIWKLCVGKADGTGCGAGTVAGRWTKFVTTCSVIPSGSCPVVTAGSAGPAADYGNYFPAAGYDNLRKIFTYFDYDTSMSSPQLFTFCPGTVSVLTCTPDGSLVPPSTNGVWTMRNDVDPGNGPKVSPDALRGGRSLTRDSDTDTYVFVAQGLAPNDNMTTNNKIETWELPGTAISNAGSVSFSVTVSLTGGGSGTVSSSPAGISCPGTCTFSFTSPVTLTESAGVGSNFLGWGSPCSSISPTCVMSTAGTVTASFAVGGPSVVLSMK